MNQKKRTRLAKKIILPSIIIMLSVILLSVLPNEADAAVYGDTIRLHILANSDSEADQALKLTVRDALLREYGAQLQHALCADDAETMARQLLPQITATANACVQAEGYAYPVEVTLTQEWYDTREYGSCTLPCGYYRSLRVLIGEANGHNWWCVMYPPLCLELALESAPADDALLSYSSVEQSLITGGRYRVRFRLLEAVSELLRC